MREDSIFDIRSITKPVTAIAALILVEKKSLDLNKSVIDILPDARSSAWAHKVTLRHLLTHTSGLGQQRPMGLDGLTESRDRLLGDVAHAILNMPLAGKTGAWQYSSLGYCVAGRMIEVAAGRSFADFVTDAVLRPLRMLDTSFIPPAHERNRMASLYQWKDGELVGWPRQLPKKKWAYDSPDFGLYSTARDLARLLGSVSSKEFALFGDPLRTVMLTPTAATDVPGLGQGLGWMIAQTDEPRGSLGIRTGCFGHNGSGGSMAWANPVTRTAAVLLTQCFFNESVAGARFMRLAFEAKAPE
jgi:CubicO group peptidase (beta-lactamase class C family)